MTMLTPPLLTHCRSLEFLRAERLQEELLLRQEARDRSRTFATMYGRPSLLCGCEWFLQGQRSDGIVSELRARL